jgi:tripartite-type tricarboxylate transporter receptor subunit TctC
MQRRIFLAGAASLLSSSASAESYPSRPIQMIVPYSAGGPADTIARIIAKGAAEKIGQPILIANRGGAGGLVGAEAAAKANPDGYTAAMLSSGQVGIALATRKSVPYDPIADFAPVIELVEDTVVLCVANALPVSTMKELIAALKAHPGKLNYSSAGVGSFTNMAMELFKSVTGVDVVHVPYKNASEGMMAILSGESSLAFSSPNAAKPFLKDGKLKVLGVASARRSPVLPDIPTLGEQGIANLDAPIWHVLAVPKATPAAVVDKLHSAYADALKTADVHDGLLNIGVEPVGAEPQAARALFEKDAKRWHEVVKAAGIELQ